MMSRNFGKQTWMALLVGICLLATADRTQAQFGTVNQIGGIEVNASGVLNELTEEMQQKVRQRVMADLAKVEAIARESSDLRAISMRALEAALHEAATGGAELTDDVRFMGGIQRIQYVIVQPEKNDILLVGPGEGWVVDDSGNVVGESTGRPVIRLEDFIVAMRTADAANKDYGISVSIDPTPEGIQRYSNLVSRMKRNGGFQPEMQQAIEETMGPQNISLTGLPKDSRMAQILTAADYRMKRMAMGFQAAAVEGIPSVLEIAQNRGKAFSQSPRFWLQCSYDSIKKSEDGKVWKIEGTGAKAMTESNNAEHKNHPVSTEWTENMTSRFGELANADPVFAELQNVMDMAVVAAIVRKHDLLVVSGMEIPTLNGENQLMDLPKWSVPQTVSTQCSFVKIKRNWMITASGGVQVDSWGVLEDVKIDNDIVSVAQRVSTSSTSVWWNSVN